MRVGAIVRLHIAKNRVRPLLVHTVHNDPDFVSGEVFLNWEEDRNAPWVLKHCFYGLSPESRTAPVKDALRGSRIGQWEEMG